MVGAATGLYDLHWGVVPWVSGLVILGVVLLAMLESAKRGGEHQERVVGPREVELARSPRDSRSVVWEIASHRIADCVPLHEGDRLRGLTLRTRPDDAYHLSLPEPVALDLAEIVMSTARAAHDGQKQRA